MRAGQGQKPVTLRRTHSLPTSYPGRHGEEVEAVRAEIKWEGIKRACSWSREKSAREKEARNHESGCSPLMCQYAHLFLFPNVKPKAEVTPQGKTADGSRVPVLCSRLAYPKMPGPQQVCREPVPSWAEALSLCCCCFPACHPWEFQKPLGSRPAYTSRWPFRMGCGNSRDVSSGILINTLSNNARVLVPAGGRENHNRVV